MGSSRSAVNPCRRRALVPEPDGLEAKHIRLQHLVLFRSEINIGKTTQTPCDGAPSHTVAKELPHYCHTDARLIRFRYFPQTSTRKYSHILPVVTGDVMNIVYVVIKCCVHTYTYVRISIQRDSGVCSVCPASFNYPPRHEASSRFVCAFCSASRWQCRCAAVAKVCKGVLLGDGRQVGGFLVWL